MRRAGIRYLVTCVVCAVAFTYLSLWTTRCTEVNRLDNNFYREEQQFVDRMILQNSRNRKYYEEILCSVNNEFTVSCRREESDVFVPFSLIKNYFEIYGQFSQGTDGDKFDWHHSNSKFYGPLAKYSPYGVFLNFDHYTVEMRDKVKCIDALNGVPLSTQWSNAGYYYATQIAQFGLSHYSKFVTSGHCNRSVVVDGESFDQSKWTLPRAPSSIQSVMDGNRKVIHFFAPKSFKLKGIQLEIPPDFPRNMLVFTIKSHVNASLTVVFESKEGTSYYVHYIPGKTVISRRRNHIFYGLGDTSSWRTVTRDVYTDLQKGLALRGSKNMRSILFVRNLISSLARIELHGRGSVDNITMSRSEHLLQFFDSANWLVANQDKNGGWPINVIKKARGGPTSSSVLQPGWYSAMAQGHAISVLVRAYHNTNSSKYLDAAKGATKLFSIPSDKGGVLAKFMQQYDWYEEYPTIPSSFVLNGFIYALFGLYDLMVTEPNFEVARELYTRGLKSLKAMLLLFDTGSGTVYDLRHQQLNKAPNLARWDYHTTHVSQLLFLATIDSDPLWNTTAQRWIGYLSGHRAAHN